MLDGLAVEREGVPAAVIVTDAFVETADAARRNQGTPAFPYLHVAHPINTLSDDELARQAAGVVGGGHRDRQMPRP